MGSCLSVERADRGNEKMYLFEKGREDVAISETDENGNIDCSNMTNCHDCKKSVFQTQVSRGNAEGANRSSNCTNCTNVSYSSNCTDCKNISQ